MDYGVGGSEGLRLAAKTLQDLDYHRSPEGNLLKSCLDYKEATSKKSPNREDQLAELRKLRDVLSPNVYFFLRGVIRPLITCTPAGLLNSCESATGKRWMETVIFDQRRTTEHFRLGHSTQGPIVRGIVAQDEEDLEYLHSLPEDLSGQSQRAMEQNLGARYLRLKVLKKKSTLKYISHYFD